MNRNRVRKAVAELLVIVVGVLLALAAQATWSERSDRIREREILTDLLAEFETNEARIRSDMETNRRASAAAQSWADAMFTGAAATADSLVPWYIASLSTARFDPVSGALRSLIDSGDLGLIRDDELRMALAGWTDRAEEARLTTEASDRLAAAVAPVVLSLTAGQPLEAGERAAIEIHRGYPAGWNEQLERLEAHVAQVIALVRQALGS